MEKEILKKRLLSWVLYLVYFIFFLNLGAMLFSWYWTIRWFDVPMHFLGGFWSILFLSWLYLFTPLGRFGKKIVFLVSGLILISLFWEFFEFILNRVSHLGANTLIDSAKDLFFDSLGGVTAYFYLKQKGIWQNK